MNLMRPGRFDDQQLVVSGLFLLAADIKSGVPNPENNRVVVKETVPSAITKMVSFIMFVIDAILQNVYYFPIKDMNACLLTYISLFEICRANRLYTLLTLLI